MKNSNRNRKETMISNITCSPTDTLPNDLPVWDTTGTNQTTGRVSSDAGTPRSYLVPTPSEPVPINWQQLNQDQGTETIILQM